MYDLGETHSVYSRSLRNFNLQGYFSNHGEKGGTRGIVIEVTIEDKFEIFGKEQWDSKGRDYLELLGKSVWKNYI